MRVQLQILSCCVLAMLSALSTVFASASSCGGPTAPGVNFGNTSTGASNYSSSSASSTSGAGTVNYSSGPSAASGSGGTYASQAPSAVNYSTPMNPTMNVSQAPTAAAGVAPRTADTTVHAGTYTTSAATTPHTSPVTSGPLSSGATTGVIAPKQILNPACDCYEYESDIAAVSNVNQIAAQQLLAGTATAGAVPWTATVDYARETASKKMEPYAIYFCSEAAARTVGESQAAKAEYKKSHDGRSPADTVFDNSGVLRAFDTAGISNFVKVPLTAENAKLAEKWNAHENTLIIAAPNDEKLKAFNREECNENNVAEYLMGFKEKYKMWKWKAQMAAVNEHNTQK